MTTPTTTLPGVAPPTTMGGPQPSGGPSSTMAPA
jgi:hypothetical protein